MLSTFLFCSVVFAANAANGFSRGVRDSLRKKAVVQVANNPSFFL